MNSRITTVAFYGIDAVEVDVQVQILNGLPAFNIVGLPNKSVAESRERIRSCLFSIGLSLPAKKIIVNLSPADVQKEGSHYDLPIALALLSAMGIIKQDDIDNFIALGELALNGGIKRVSGILPAAICAKISNKGIICPKTSVQEATWAGYNAIIGAEDILELINHINGKQIISIADNQHTTDSIPVIANCMSEVKGQYLAKKAIEVAAAGGHNLLMSGPPGVGKSLLASRVNNLLPPLSPSEALEVTMIYSLVNGLPDSGIISSRPYRSPHHSASLVSLVGGGIKAQPGEISLAHCGVLFLDELPEFSRATLESLRQPLETGKVTIARANHHITYPSRVQLIAAMNPCRCGFLGTRDKECKNAPICGKEYLKKISGPLLDRFDLSVQVDNIPISEFKTKKENIETSEAIRERVNNARLIQTERFREDSDIITNSDARGEDLEKYLTDGAKNLLYKCVDRYSLSARGFYKIIKVSRTIADIANQESISEGHVSESVSLRYEV